MPVTAVADAVPVAGRPVVVMVTETVTRLLSIERADTDPVSPLTARRRAVVVATADLAAIESTIATPVRAEVGSISCAPARAA